MLDTYKYSAMVSIMEISKDDVQTFQNVKAAIPDMGVWTTVQGGANYPANKLALINESTKQDHVANATRLLASACEKLRQRWELNEDLTDAQELLTILKEVQWGIVTLTNFGVAMNNAQVDSGLMTKEDRSLTEHLEWTAGMQDAVDKARVILFDLLYPKGAKEESLKPGWGVRGQIPVIAAMTDQHRTATDYRAVEEDFRSHAAQQSGLNLLLSHSPDQVITDGFPVAHIQYNGSRPSNKLNRLVVHKDMRRRGYGTELLRRATGGREATVNVTPHEDYDAFFDALGFERNNDGSQFTGKVEDE